MKRDPRRITADYEGNIGYLTCSAGKLLLLCFQVTNFTAFSLVVGVRLMLCDISVINIIEAVNIIKKLIFERAHF